MKNRQITDRVKTKKAKWHERELFRAPLEIAVMAGFAWMVVELLQRL